MTKTIKENLPALKKLLKVHDVENLNYALEIATSLNSPEIWAQLLEGVDYVQGQPRSHLKKKNLPSTIGHLIPGKHFAKSPAVLLWNELVSTYLLARSELELRDQITHLELLGGTKLKPLPIKLDGLENLRNLESLVLEVYAETDLSVLSKFKKLKTLTIYDHRHYIGASDITLSGLKQLSTLTITAPESEKSFRLTAPSHTPQCANLSALPKLTTAKLYCDLGDISGLDQVTTLSVNILRDYKINEACKNLKDLTCLVIAQPHIKIPKGATLTSNNLDITNDVEDLGEIGQVQGLKMVVFGYWGYHFPKLSINLNPKTDLSPLMTCTELKVIKLVRDIDVSVLEGHPSLKMITCVGTSIRKDNVPASMKKIINRAAKPNIVEALKDEPAPIPTTKTKPLKITAASRKQVSQLRKLLTQPDYTSLIQGVELAASINNPEVFAMLLDGVVYTEEPLQTKYGNRPVTLVVEGRLIPNKIFSGSQFRQPWLDVAMALLLAHSKLPLKKQVRGLTLGHRLYSTCPMKKIPLLGLEKLPNLERLELFLESSQADLTPITELPALKKLGVHGKYRTNDIAIPSNGSVEVIEGAQVSLNRGGSWPNLKTLDIERRHGDLPSTDSFPKLETIKTSGTLHLKDFKQLTKLIATDSIISTDNCPRLTHLVGKRIDEITIIGDSALEKVSLDYYGKSAEFLQQLTSLKTLEFSSSRVLSIAIPKGASLSGELSLNSKQLHNLGNLGELENLQRLSLRGVDAPLDLSTLANAKALRVLDIQHADGITDLSPLAGLPELRLVAVKNSGVVNYPDELAAVVSRADQPDLLAAFNKPRPKAKTTKKKIPVPESQRTQWMEVIANLATNSIENALRAIDLAATLDPAGLEFLAGKIKINNDKLRAYAPISLDHKLMLAEVASALLCKMPTDSKTARPLRAMRKLVIEGSNWGSDTLKLRHLSGFLSLEHLVVRKMESIIVGDIDPENITTMRIRAKHSLSLEGKLPDSLKQLLIGKCYRVSIDPIGSSQLETLYFFEITSPDISGLAGCETLTELHVHPSSYRFSKSITGEAVLSKLNLKKLVLPSDADMSYLIDHPTLEQLLVAPHYKNKFEIPEGLIGITEISKSSARENLLD